MIIEERPIPRYPLYRATAHGEIISLQYGKRRVMRQQMVRGLLQVTVRDESGKRTSCTVAALVAAAFHGDKRGTVRFLDGNSMNVRPSNLEWNDDTVVLEEPEGLVPVRGYANLFADPQGTIYSRAGKHNDGKLRKLAVHYSAKGYPRVSFYRNGKATSQPIHLLVAAAFLPEPLDGQTMVRHLDGDRENFLPQNLEWGTHGENMEDARHHFRLHQVRSLRPLGVPALVRRFRISPECVERALDDAALPHNLIRRNFVWN